MGYHWSLADARAEVEREEDPERRAALHELLRVCEERGVDEFHARVLTPELPDAETIRGLAEVLGATREDARNPDGE